MNTYYINTPPDYYQFIKITPIEELTEESIVNTKEKSLIKLFCVYIGRCGRGNSWKLNSGVKNLSINGDLIDVLGYSGSVYSIPLQECVQMSAYGANILNSLVENLEKGGYSVELMRLNDVLEEFL